MFFCRFRKQKYVGYVFIAHNAKGFDSSLLRNYLVSQAITPSVIMQGSKVLQFEDRVYSQKYIDSLSFLTMRLSAMPKCLGFDGGSGDVGQGFFPHCFSSEGCLDYVGPYLPLEAYGIDRMLEAEKKEFDVWYTSKLGRRHALLR